jgi:hypothetical protein
MQFYPTGTDPTSSALLVCRNVRWNLLLLLAIFWAIPGLFWYFSAPWFLVWLSAVLPLLLTWPILGSWRKRGSTDNWVLALQGDGLWLNLRDCEYAEAQTGNSIVFLPCHEIASARRVVHRYTTPSSDSDSTTYRDVYLELRLRNDSDSSVFKKAIADERGRELPEHAHLGGAITSRRRRSGAPIEMEGKDAVRIKFTVGNYGLRPGLNKVLATLGSLVTVEADEQQITEHWKSLSDNEFDAFVCRLVSAGKEIDATHLLQHRSGWTTTEAHNFIEELEAKLRSANTK